MSNAFLQPVERDERAVAVENTSYTLGFFVLSTLILSDACYRFLVHHEFAWDLIAFVFTSFAVCQIYQARCKVSVRGWPKIWLLMVFSGVGGVVIGIIMLEIIHYLTVGHW